MLWSDISTKRRLRELEEMVAKLESRLEEVKRLGEAHDLQWTEMRARCKRLLDRTEKAYDAISTAEKNRELPFDGGGAGESLPANVLGATSERMRRIRQQLGREPVVGRKEG